MCRVPKSFGKYLTPGCKVPTLQYTLHSCCLLYTSVVTKCHCAGAALEQRQEQCWTTWMERMQRQRRRRCRAGLSFSSVLPTWAWIGGLCWWSGSCCQLADFIWLSFVFFESFFKLCLWPQLVECSDLLVLLVQAEKSARQMKMCWYSRNEPIITVSCVTKYIFIDTNLQEQVRAVYLLETDCGVGLNSVL